MQVGRRFAVLVTALAAAVMLAGASRAEAASHRITHQVAAGVALAGKAVVWGERYSDGSIAVIRQASGARAQVLKAVARPGSRTATVGFSGLPGAVSASPQLVAVGLDRGTQECRGGDSCSVQSTARTLVSRAGGPFADAFPGCAHAYLSTDADQQTVAVAQSVGTCGQAASAASVWVQEGDAPAREIARSADPDGFFGSVHVAGSYVAWSEGRGGDLKRVTVADRATGAVIAALTPADLGGTTIASFDLDAEGHIATIVRSGRHNNAVVLSLPNRALTVLSRNAGYVRIAIAGGWVALVTAHGSSAGRLVLLDLQGRTLRTLMRFRRRDLQPTVGQDIALTADRVAWSFVRNRTGDPTQGGRGGIRNVALP